MFWVDEIAAEIDRAFPDKSRTIVIRDEKTASGKVHVGSLRGVVIHGVLAEALQKLGRKAHFFYEINDVDPMDGMPVYLDAEAYAEHMGKPLRHVPAPDENGRPIPDAPTPTHNFARTYGNQFVKVIRRLGFTEKTTTIVWASDLYDAGHYDEWIIKACAQPEKIAAIYKKISGSDKGEEWNPLQMVCEQCGKVGTTTVTEFDGKLTAYRCEPSKVKWAQGCGYEGKASPFGGKGKLPWKVEWAVKWAGFPRPGKGSDGKALAGRAAVDVEGSGKDHNAAGGSHDVSEAIAREVLNIQPPFNIPYEFFLFGGAKMSASKGLGATAKEVADAMPAELLRFLMVRTRPNQPIDFSMDNDTIPRLYDNHDECAQIYFDRLAENRADNPIQNSDLGQAFYYAQLNPEKITPRFFPRFSRIVFTTQIPHLSIEKEVEKMKGAALTKEDKKEADERAEYAQRWLRDFAPENAKFEVQKEIPDLTHELSSDQKEFLSALADVLEKEKPASGEALHARIHELRKSSPLAAREGFGAIYAALLGKNSGPQAGWFLEALDQKFLISRFKKVAALPLREKQKIENLVTSYLIVNRVVREKFPGLKFGFNTLKGVTIKKSHPDNPDLAALRAELWQGLDFEALKKKSPRLEAYRELFRGFGVKPSNQKPSPVALISRLANGKELPNINVAVDIANILVVKHQLSLGIFNLNALSLPLTLKLSEGGEPFQALGTEKAVLLNPGELCYFDATGLTVARDFNYIDSELTKTTACPPLGVASTAEPSTQNLLLNVDGTSACTLAELEAFLIELETLLQKYCGGILGDRLMLSAQ